MSYPVFYPSAGSVLDIPFSTYGKTNGESITLTGLATTDIEIYKAASMTQRSSDSGYSLVDTDGIDIDGITGIHAFSIDLSDDTVAGFYEVGQTYFVIVSAITVDSQTVNFIAAWFRIMASDSVEGVPAVNVTHVNGTAIPTPNVAGVLVVDVGYFGGTAGTFAGGRPETNASHIGGSSISQSAGVINANMAQVSGDATAADNFELMLDGTGGVTLSADIGGSVTGISGQSFPTNFELMVIDDSGVVDANVEEVNGQTIVGAGVTADKWRPS